MLPWCREGRKAGNTGAKILVQSVRRRCQERQEICKYGAKRYNFFAKPNLGLAECIQEREDLGLFSKLDASGRGSEQKPV